MSGSFSYASFSPRDGRPGGWSVGHSAGDLEPMWTDELIALIPTQIADPVALSSFPDKTDLARRLRRFAWLPAPWEPADAADTGVFFASSPAGQDNSGRPGNVFTYVHVSDPGELPRHYAVSLMFSPSVPAPYGKRKVDDAVLPSLGPGAAGAGESPLTDTVVEAFLAGAPSEAAGGPGSLPTEFSRVTAPQGPASRPEALGVLVQLVMNGQPVVLLTDPVEGPLWVAALAHALPETLPDGRSFTWSTYERAGGVAKILALGTSLVVVPAGDRDKLPENTAAVLVDPAGPLPSGDALAPVAAVTPDVPTSYAAQNAGGGWGSAFGAAPVAQSSHINSPANPFSNGPADPAPVPGDAPAAAFPAPSPAAFPAPSPAVDAPLADQEPAPAAPTSALPPVRETPPGIHPAIARLRKDDEDFIRHARITSWDTAVNEQPPYGNDAEKNRWVGKQLTNYRTYLLLDPVTELGWTSRVRVLALLSYGYIPPSKGTAGRTSLNEWTLTALYPRTAEELITDTVTYTLDHGWADERIPDLSLIGEPELKAMTEEVFRRRTELRPLKPQPRQAQQAQQFPQGNYPYASRQPQYIPSQPGQPGPGWPQR